MSKAVEEKLTTEACPEIKSTYLPCLINNKRVQAPSRNRLDSCTLSTQLSLVGSSLEKLLHSRARVLSHGVGPHPKL